MGEKYAGSESEEHRLLVDLACKKFAGIKRIKRGNITNKGMYFPDVEVNNLDIECELTPKSYLEAKFKKWDKTRKKILVIGFPMKVLKNFDDIYVDNLNNELIKIK